MDFTLGPLGDLLIYFFLVFGIAFFIRGIIRLGR